jgi:hypothetical protein
MSKGFYKEESNEVWGFANRFYLPNGSVVTEDNHEEHDLPTGYAWYEESPETSEFEKWEARLSAITSLKEQGQESALMLPISEFYDDSQEVISEFIKNGSDEFLLLSQESELAWMDMRTAPENPSPREILVSVLSPLVIQ